MLVLGRVSSVLLNRMDKFDNFLAFTVDVCRSESRDMAGCIVILLWQIWATRNDCVWNDERETLNGIGRLALGNW
jgi:hypothetical protein